MWQCNPLSCRGFKLTARASASTGQWLESHTPCPTASDPPGPLTPSHTEADSKVVTIGKRHKGAVSQPLSTVIIQSISLT